MKHPDKAVTNRLKQLNDARKAENAQREKEGKPPLPLFEDPAKSGVTGYQKKHEPLYPGYDAELMLELVEGMWGAMGDLLNVSDQARPSTENCKKMANALVQTSKYYDFMHPRYLCLLMLAQSAIRCAKPIAREAIFGDKPQPTQGSHEFVEQEKPTVDAETTPPAADAAPDPSPAAGSDGDKPLADQVAAQPVEV